MLNVISEPQSHRSISARPIWIVVILSVLWAGAMAFDLVPVLRGGYGWQWDHRAPDDLARLIPFLLTLTVYLFAAWRLVRRWRAGLFLTWAVAGSVALTLVGIFVRGDPLFELYGRTVAAEPTGWHRAAASIEDLDATLRDWPNFMQEAKSYSMHMRLSPPGIVLIYYAASQVLQDMPAVAEWLARPLRTAQCRSRRLMSYSHGELASAWLGILMPLWGGLTSLALYWLGRYFYSEQTARWSTIWWPLVPGLLSFAATPNTVYPLFAVVVIALLVKSLNEDKQAWALASGVVMSGLTFLNLSVLPLIFMALLLVFGAYLAKIGWLQARRVTRVLWRRPLITSFWFVLGLSVFWVAYLLPSGVSPWSLFEVMLSEHTELDRPYLPWLFLHANDIFMFVGLPLALLAAVNAWRVVKAMRSLSPVSIGDMLILITFVTLIVLDLSGILRGESGRVLMFMYPFLLLSAAEALQHLGVEHRQRSGRLVTGIQGLMALVLIAFVPAVMSGLHPSPSAPPDSKQDPPRSSTSIDAIFDGVLHLRAFSGEIQTRRAANGREHPALALWLRWESSGQTDTQYQMSLLPVAPNGEVAASATVEDPFGGEYPTTCWLPSDGPIEQYMEVPLFADGGEGDWWISLALFDNRTGNRADVTLPDGSHDDQVGIGPFRSK